MRWPREWRMHCRDLDGSTVVGEGCRVLRGAGGRTDGGVGRVGSVFVHAWWAGHRISPLKAHHRRGVVPCPPRSPPSPRSRSTSLSSPSRPRPRRSRASHCDFVLPRPPHHLNSVHQPSSQNGFQRSNKWHQSILYVHSLRLVCRTATVAPPPPPLSISQSPYLVVLALCPFRHIPRLFLSSFFAAHPLSMSSEPDSSPHQLALDDPHRIVRVVASDGKTNEQREIAYTNCKVIGNGSFGVVFQARLVSEPRETEDIAIKKVLQDKRFKVGFLLFISPPLTPPDVLPPSRVMLHFLPVETALLITE